MPPIRRSNRRPPANRAPGAQVRKNTVRLSGDVAGRVRVGHPWVYREALGTRGFAPEPGTSIDCIDPDGEFVGRGLYDADSTIALRIFVRSPDVQIDGKLVRDRVRAAIALRRRVVDLDKLGCVRLINAESDGLPGIVVERYGDYLVTQRYTSAVTKLRDDLFAALEAELHPKAIYEQRRYRSLGGEAPRQGAAELVRGDAAPVEVGRASCRERV